MKKARRCLTNCKNCRHRLHNLRNASLYLPSKAELKRKLLDWTKGQEVDGEL